MRNVVVSVILTGLLMSCSVTNKSSSVQPERKASGLLSEKDGLGSTISEKSIKEINPKITNLDFSLPGLNLKNKFSLSDSKPKHVALIFIKPFTGKGGVCLYCRKQLEDFEYNRSRLLSFKNKQYVTPEGKSIQGVQGMEAVFVFPGSKANAKKFINSTPFGKIVPKKERIPRRSYHNSLNTPFLYDKNGSLARRLGLDTGQPAIAVVNPQGTVEKIFLETNGERISAEELMETYEIPWND